MGGVEHIFDKYLRQDKLPQMWCPGCGNGIVLQAIIRAVDELGLEQDKVVVVAGVGCSGRANGYTDFCGVHTNHGRALAYATGIKMQKPELNVIVVTGDGDCTSIGGNHFIHACRSAEVFAFGEHLQQLAATHANLQLHLFHDQGPVGNKLAQIAPLQLSDLAPVLPLVEAECYLCGPVGFMQTHIAALQQLGVSKQRIHAELFSTGGIHV